MKIKTITCHDVYNTGASLQAYALMAYLEGLGNEVEIIDYKPAYLNNHYKLNAVPAKYKKVKIFYVAAKLPARIKKLCSKRKRAFDKFKTEYLKLTPIKYTSNEQLKSAPPEADVYFAGSDQIWNPVFRNGRDAAFYLDFVTEGKVRASYAASFSADSIPEAWKGMIKIWIDRLDNISVREATALNILQSIGIDRGEVVLDPVFLLGQKEWREIAARQEDSEKYIVVYDFDNSEIVKRTAQKIAGERRLKIFSVLQCGYADKCFYQSGPTEFLSLIAHAEYVVSNSFHATAFSLIFQKQFVVINRTESLNSRMQDLIGMFGLSERLVGEDGQVPDDVDYGEVSLLVTEKIELSKKYIAKVLSEGNCR